jgi:septal ring-binding cell division protein DamX
VNCRFFLGVLSGATSSQLLQQPPHTNQRTLANGLQGETSWHCEEIAGAWSCKRRTIGEIQQRQAATDARKYDWSQAESAEEEPHPAWREGSATRSPRQLQDALRRNTPRRPSRDRATSRVHKSKRDRRHPPALNSQAQTHSPTPGLAEQEPTGYQRLMYRPDTPMSLEELPSSYWTVQLIALSSARELQGFMSTLQIDGLTGANDQNQ